MSEFIAVLKLTNTPLEDAAEMKQLLALAAPKDASVLSVIEVTAPEDAIDRAGDPNVTTTEAFHIMLDFIIRAFDEQDPRPTSMQTAAARAARSEKPS